MLTSIVILSRALMSRRRCSSAAEKFFFLCSRDSYRAVEKQCAVPINTHYVPRAVPFPASFSYGFLNDRRRVFVRNYYHVRVLFLCVLLALSRTTRSKPPHALNAAGRIFVYLPRYMLTYVYVLSCNMVCHGTHVHDGSPVLCISVRSYRNITCRRSVFSRRYICI